MKQGGALAGIVLLSALLVAVVACGGGDQGGATTPGPSATATPSATEALLKGMVVQLSDLPAGFSQQDDSFSTNQEVADASGSSAEAELAKLTQWGRILGHSVSFAAGGTATPESGVLMVESNVSVYQSDTGAAASYADALNTARTTDWKASMQGATDVQVEEVPPLDVADEMLWLRINIKAAIGESATEQSFVQDFVILRLGRVRGNLSVGYQGGSNAAQFVESLIRKQAANMAAGLH